MVPIRWAQPRACAKWTQTLHASYSASARARSYATAQTSRDGRPFRLAIIGSGPAGFYTAYRAMSRIQDVKVDMYEALPVPYGLVRFGVAPDHPEVKVPGPAPPSPPSHRPV